MKSFLTQSQTRQLLHNKFVVILGGSVQRSMYKDLVLLLQRDQYLTLPQLKSKGEFSFEQDVLVEGGRLGPMTNGTEYREVRQYRSDHHLLRFYFVTRIYSPYMESILEDFRRGLKPDVVIISSCVWDITRYGQNCLEEYKENLDKFFGQIKTIIYRKCLLLWCLAMPIGQTIKGGFLVPEVSHLGATLCYDIIEANFFGGSLAEAYGFDVLDLHFHFRFSLQHRMPDGVHWDTLAHRRVSSLLLQHIADAWGVDLHDPFTRPAQEPYQRCEPVQYQQSYRSDRFQLLPPNSDRTETIRPPLVRMLPPNQPAQTAGCHHGAVDPAMHYPQQLLRQQNSGVRPPRGRRFAAAGNWRLSSQNLPPDDLWLSQWDYPPVRDACSQMDSSSGGGFRIRPHFQTDDNYKRRRRRRTNIRTHPYPPHLPQIRLRCASERFLLRDPLGAIGRVDQRSDGDGQPTQPLVLRDELRGAQGILGREEDRSEQMQTVSPRPPGSSSVTPETPPRGTQSPTKTSAGESETLAAADILITATGRQTNNTGSKLVFNNFFTAEGEKNFTYRFI